MYVNKKKKHRESIQIYHNIFMKFWNIFQWKYSINRGLSFQPLPIETIMFSKHQSAKTVQYLG